jgi:photosystem II stability/assembly factor-like uncharacterized protein
MKLLPVNTTANFRAVSAASKKVIWVGGSSGTFLRSTNGGNTWQIGTVAGAETCDFRDVQAIDTQTAVLMSAGPAEQGQARIYRTTNGGKSWLLTYQTQQAGVFFDGLSFWNARQGIAFSDPVAGHYFLLRTNDGGQTWQPIPASQSPRIHSGEAAFAASGSSIVTQDQQNVWIGSGGVGGGRVFRSTDGGQSWAVSETGLPADSSSGVFGLHFVNTKEGIAVGGNHKNSTKPGPNAAFTHDGGRTWSLTKSTPGLKEATWRLPNGQWLLVGPSGTGLITSDNKGEILDQEPFHALVCVGNTCWAVGAKGRVARRTF